MAGDTDSDYTNPLSLISGFDIGINFEEFGENMKKFMELPVKYLDSAHDKVVELVEDIHAIIRDPFHGDDIPNIINETLKDPSIGNVVSESSTASFRMGVVAPSDELSSPSTSIVAAQDSFLGPVATDGHETESILTKRPGSDYSSEGGNIEVNDHCMLPVNTLATEISEKPSDNCTSEYTVLLGRAVSTEEELILWNPSKSVNLQSPEFSACDGEVILGVTAENGEEQTTLHSINDPEESIDHGDLLMSSVTPLHDLTTTLSNSTNDSNICLDDLVEFVEINLQDDQEQMEIDASSLSQPKNTSFKKKLMRGLSNKLRWPRKHRDVNKPLHTKSQESGNVSYQAFSLSDDMENDWELL